MRRSARQFRLLARRQTALLRAAIVAYFSGYKLTDITHGELEKFKQHRLAAPIVFERKTKEEKLRLGGRVITTVNRELMAIRAMLRKAQREGWLLKTQFEEKDS